MYYGTEQITHTIEFDKTFKSKTFNKNNEVYTRYLKI